MKKHYLIIGAFTIVLVIFLLVKLKDYFPPRTPIKIARVQSNLNIPADTKVLDFKEQYSFTGEGYIYVLLKLDEKSLEDIIKECIRKKYRELTIENLIADKFIQPNIDYGIKLYDRDITSIKEGYYKLNAIDLNKLDFGITVIDKQKKELTIYINIP